MHTAIKRTSENANFGPKGFDIWNALSQKLANVRLSQCGSSFKSFMCDGRRREWVKALNFPSLSTEDQFLRANVLHARLLWKESLKSFASTKQLKSRLGQCNRTYFAKNTFKIFFAVCKVCFPQIVIPFPTHVFPHWRLHYSSFPDCGAPLLFRWRAHWRIVNLWQKHTCSTGKKQCIPRKVCHKRKKTMTSIHTKIIQKYRVVHSSHLWEAGVFFPQSASRWWTWHPWA